MPTKYEGYTIGGWRKNVWGGTYFSIYYDGVQEHEFYILSSKPFAVKFWAKWACRKWVRRQRKPSIQNLGMIKL